MLRDIKISTFQLIFDLSIPRTDSTKYFNKAMFDEILARSWMKLCVLQDFSDVLETIFSFQIPLKMLKMEVLRIILTSTNTSQPN